MDKDILKGWKIPEKQDAFVHDLETPLRLQKGNVLGVTITVDKGQIGFEPLVTLIKTHTPLIEDEDFWLAGFTITKYGVAAIPSDPDRFHKAGEESMMTGEEGKTSENKGYVRPLTILESSASLDAAILRAREIAYRRGIPLEDWLAQAIEDKNALETGCTMDERAQGRANEDQG